MLSGSMDYTISVGSGTDALFFGGPTFSLRHGTCLYWIISFVFVVIPHGIVNYYKYYSIFIFIICTSFVVCVAGVGRKETRQDHII